jgi:hypothetical protein
MERAAHCSFGSDETSSRFFDDVGEPALAPSDGDVKILISAHRPQAAATGMFTV